MGGEGGLAWKQTEQSLTLARGEQIVWQFNYKKDEGKPYFHPVTISGGETLTDLRPADHVWHRALWFSWKFINELNYWEEDKKTGKSQGETELVDAKATAREDHSARFDMELSYHPPGKPALLTERRTIEVSAPNADGAYRMDWTMVFTAADTDVLLDRTPIMGEPKGVGWGGYAGLSLRLAPALKSWNFTGSDGPETKSSAVGKWIAFSGPVKDGKNAGIVVLDHPKSFRHPTSWYLIKGMPYFSPAVLYKSAHTLPAKQSITLRYRILFQPGVVDGAAVEKEWQKFANE
jgi:hypothetical protein